MSTYFPKGEIARKWFVIDADGQTLGRLASRIARILSGKDSPKYTPFMDSGDHHRDQCREGPGYRPEGRQQGLLPLRGFPGGMKAEEFKKRFQRKPEQIVEEAITGMSPHTKLGVRWLAS